MARYAVTAVFEVGAGKVPRGADVLQRALPAERTTHRFSYCDGRTLTAVVDQRAPDPAAACVDVVRAVRAAWTRLAGADPGRPLTVRVRALSLPARISAGAVRRREWGWTPDGGPSGRLVLLHPGDTVPGGDGPEGPGDPDDPDDGGLAGVREPRRPGPGPGLHTAALEEPRAVPPLPDATALAELPRPSP